MAGRLRNEMIRVLSPSGKKLPAGIVCAQMLDDGAEMVRVPAAEVTGRMDVNARVTSFVALKESEPWDDDSVTVFLDQALNFIKCDVIPLFDPFFGESA